MGIGVNVACPCHGSFVLPVGPRIAPPPYCLFPFLCTACKTSSCLDIHAESLRCSHCGSDAVVPYGDRAAVGERGRDVVFACEPSARFSSEQLMVTDGTYWCPTCRQYSARFSDAGLLWD